MDNLETPDIATEIIPSLIDEMPNPNPPDFYNEMLINGQKYYSAVQASDSLPEGYVLLREITETEAMGTELAGCKLFPFLPI